MGQYDFLRSIKIVDETKTPTRLTVDKNPANLSIRVFQNGRVFPSKELVEKYKLEYGVEGECGIDYFASTDWKAYPQDQKPVIFMAFVSRKESKISLFTKPRAVKGEEKKSVLTHGPKDLELWNLIKKVYGVEEALYIDLIIDPTLEVKPENGICNVPKTYTKGEDKGKPTYERRENVNLYPMIPAVLTAEDAKDVEQPDSLAELIN